MKNLLIKNTLRSARKSKGRFFSIMAIIAIGCAFFSGVKTSCPYMKRAAWNYFNRQELADLHLKSALGFSNEDVSEISAYSETEDIYAGYSAELFYKTNSENLIFTVYSFDPESNINKLVLEDGRFPENDGECLIDYSLYKGRHFDIGEKITLTGDDTDDISDVLSRSEYTVCGLVRSPVYISFERGAASVGNGTVNGYIYVPESNFAYNCYTDVYITGKGLSGIDPYSEDYSDHIEFLKGMYENLGESRIGIRCEEVRAESDEELAEARSELEDARKQYDLAKKTYNTGVRQYESGKAELSAKKNEYEKASEQYEEAEKNLMKAKKDLSAVMIGCSYSENCIQEYADSSLSPLPQDIRAKLNDMQDALDTYGIEINLREMTAMYIITPPEEATEKARIGTELAAAAAQVRSGCDTAEGMIDSQQKILDKTKASLLEASEQIDKYTDELERSKEQLDEGKKDLDEAGKKIDDAAAEIEEKEAELGRLLNNAEWYVLSRDEINPYYSHYSEDADRVDAIARVFPLFFILVAALVCICTMTRMAEEQRTEAGTLKALGISSGAVTAQYIGYAAAASIIGSVIGVPLGIFLIPRVIFIAYQTMYSFPSITTPLRADYFFGCMAASLICTCVSSFIAQKSTSSENPASLIRPKPPANGKRIFLEKITFIWKKMSFTHKVTFRNLFRYKIKLLMTVIGIAGCTALLLTGFGLRHSVSSIVDKQFGSIFIYDIFAVTKDNITDMEKTEITSFLADSPYVNGYVSVSQNSADVRSGEKKVEQCYILAPSDGSELEHFISMRSPDTGIPLKISDSGVIINEKLAYLLGAKIGSSIMINGASSPAEVTGITENYTYNYVYMSEKTHNELFGEFRPNALLINMTADAEPEEISKSLIACGGIGGISMSADGSDKFHKLVKSLDLVVAVIIFFSGALAVVILFNLASINITERIRELATIKVLGFFDSEVTAYIIRENVISSILGMIPGLLIGIFLENFVVRTAEVDVVMFAHDIPPLCFGYAAAVTAAFIMLVNVIMHFRMKRINMSDSLKAAE